MLTQEQLFNKIKSLSQIIDQAAATVQNDFDHPDFHLCSSYTLLELKWEMIQKLEMVSRSVAIVKEEAIEFFDNKIKGQY